MYIQALVVPAEMNTLYSYAASLISISHVSKIHQVQLLLQDMTQTHPV